jgi:hypothetical protein
LLTFASTGKEDKAKQLLLPESPSTAPAEEEESKATLTTSISASISTTTSQEGSPHPPSPVDSASSAPPSCSFSFSSTTTSPSSSHVVATRTASSDKVTDAGDDDDLCKLCFESPIDTVILDCGHALLCSRFASLSLGQA